MNTSTNFTVSNDCVAITGEEAYPNNGLIVDLTIIKFNTCSKFQLGTHFSPKHLTITHLNALEALNFQGTVFKSAAFHNDILTSSQQKETVAINDSR